MAIGKSAMESLAVTGSGAQGTIVLSCVHEGKPLTPTFSLQFLMACGPPMHDENDLGRPCICCSCAISWRLWHAGEAA